MKKTIALLLALVLCLSLCACGGNNQEDESTNHTTEANVQEKKLVTVEITLDNWQEYFEIRPYEESFYNDFGDLTGKNVGYALFLKDEYLSKLAVAGPQLPDGSVDVSFKVGVTIEYREYDKDNDIFVEGGKIHSTEDEELVIKAYDRRKYTDTDAETSTGNGQVCAKMYCTSAVSDAGYYQGVYTDDIDVLDVTGTLVFVE